jgi:hypothetical protein
MDSMHKRGIIDVTIDTNSLRAQLKNKSLPQAFYNKVETTIDLLLELRSSVIEDDDLYDALSGMINIIDYSIPKKKA